MFGLLMGLFNLGARAAASIHDYKENEKNKIRYQEYDGLAYMDEKLATRLLSNNHQVMRWKVDGDDCLVDVDDHWKVIKNFSEEERKKIPPKKTEAEQKIEAFNHNSDKRGGTVYMLDCNDNLDKEIKGKRFIDKITKDIYVVRCINNTVMFMNIETKLFVRYTDTQMYYLKNKDNKNEVFLNCYKGTWILVDDERTGKKKYIHGIMADIDKLNAEREKLPIEKRDPLNDCIAGYA